MNCKPYLDLSEIEAKHYLGSVIHAIQSDPICFEAGKEIIELAEAKGKFEGVKIGNDAFNDDLAISSFP